MGILRSVRRGVTWVSLGVAGGAAVVTVRHLLRTPQPLESVLQGETHIDRKHGGDLFYNVAGPADAAPLVLLHDFSLGASNFEYRAVFAPLSRTARVFAPDWLGFGMSERPNLAYTGEFYANSLAGFLRDVVKRPATVVAHGLAANVAARAASDAPGLFERLVLVSPVAFAGEGNEPTAAQTAAHTAQRFSLGLVPYALLATRPILKRLAGGPIADEERVDHLYASAHQFGGHFAALALLSGELDLPIRNLLPLLEPPLLIVSGEQDIRRPREAMEDLAVLNPHADLDVIANAGQLVFEDQPSAFIAAVTDWIGAPATRHLLDESALLPAIGDLEPATVTMSTADTSSSDDEREAPSTGTTGATEDEVGTPAGLGGGAPSSAAEDADDDDDTLVGTPGYVVPGVSDMGLDGPAVVTMGVVANIAPDASSTPDADDSAAPDETTDEDDDSPDALLPEAGDASPRDEAERRARESIDPGANIADLPVAADEDAEAPETPTAPQRVARVSAAKETPASVPQLRTNSVARNSASAKTRPSANGSARTTPLRRPSSVGSPSARTIGRKTTEKKPGKSGERTNHSKDQQ